MALLAANIAAVLLLSMFLQEHATIIFILMEAAAVAVAINIQSTSAPGQL